MTAEEFRSLALSLPEAVESSHMAHPDFRVRGKVFASLGYPDEMRASVKLLPDQQLAFISALPKVFAPAAGAWGARGYTIIALRTAKTNAVHDALAMAWRNTAPRQLLKVHPDIG